MSENSQNKLVRHYSPDPLQELLMMCRYARDDMETAYYRQRRFLGELESWHFYEQPGFENLPAEIDSFKQAMEHNNELIDRIYKRLREINDAMIAAEKECGAFSSLLEPATDGDNASDLKAAMGDIDQLLMLLNSDSTPNGK